ncbi:MAG TPA: maleylpyruvate isomerase family mycothiol-dependent enzyme [Frankiaceae bacterium]|nr:maleylpyruvate isomerase family mycothiol-dependent enzyme [Frankiaceae bacterium]
MGDARRPVLDRATAMRLAATEYGRFHQTLVELAPQEWTLATNCPGWDVRAMAAHLLGMADMASSPWESRRQIKEATKRGGAFIDELTAFQVEEREELEPGHILAQYERAGRRASKGRRRMPGLIRRRRLPAAQTDGLEDWTLGYLVDVILTRDPWMHRMDIAAVTGREPDLTADHDGVLVDDVVREWASRHGQPCALTLTGPAGGSWTFGEGGPDLHYDAVEFCRQVGGRGDPEGVLKTLVPF